MNEQGYLNLLQKILDDGVSKDDRTGIGTYSLFGEQLKFNLDGQFPLLTTKRVYWKGVAKELLWFIKGSTNSNELEDEGVRIWSGNTTREFLDNRGLSNYDIGDIGPMYGFQWRHFNAEYNGCKNNYTGKGIDQLNNIIQEIKENPNSRRLLMTAFNPSAVDESVLMPCHVLVQFNVTNGFLNCHMTQRSMDTFLGESFNIASYALLTYMIAHVTDLKPGTLIISGGDVHIYKNHIEQVKEQLSRKPYNFPTLVFNRKVDSIDDFKFEDFEICDYKFHPTIKAPMAI